MSQFSDFMSYARKAVDRDIYVWGGGQPVSSRLKTLSQLTEANIRSWESGNGSTHINNAIALWNARKNVYPDAYAADCSGGIIYCMYLAGIVSGTYDLNSAGLMAAGRTITKAELRPGDWVGQHNGTRVVHIGLVDSVDNGVVKVIEWKGRANGCVRTNLSDVGTWNRYTRPSSEQFYTYEPELPEEPAEPVVISCDKPTLKSGTAMGQCICDVKNVVATPYGVSKVEAVYYPKVLGQGASLSIPMATTSVAGWYKKTIDAFGQFGTFSGRLICRIKVTDTAGNQYVNNEYAELAF